MSVYNMVHGHGSYRLLSMIGSERLLSVINSFLFYYHFLINLGPRSYITSLLWKESSIQQFQCTTQIGVLTDRWIMQEDHTHCMAGAQGVGRLRRARRP